MLEKKLASIESPSASPSPAPDGYGGLGTHTKLSSSGVDSAFLVSYFCAFTSFLRRYQGSMTVPRIVRVLICVFAQSYYNYVLYTWIFAVFGLVDVV